MFEATANDAHHWRRAGDVQCKTKTGSRRPVHVPCSASEVSLRIKRLEESQYPLGQVNSCFLVSFKSSTDNVALAQCVPGVFIFEMLIIVFESLFLQP